MKKEITKPFVYKELFQPAKYFKDIHARTGWTSKSHAVIASDMRCCTPTDFVLDHSHQLSKIIDTNKVYLKIKSVKKLGTILINEVEKKKCLQTGK